MKSSRLFNFLTEVRDDGVVWRLVRARNSASKAWASTSVRLSVHPEPRHGAISISVEMARRCPDIMLSKEARHGRVAEWMLSPFGFSVNETRLELLQRPIEDSKLDP